MRFWREVNVGHFKPRMMLLGMSQVSSIRKSLSDFLSDFLWNQTPQLYNYICTSTVHNMVVLNHITYGLFYMVMLIQEVQRFNVSVRVHKQDPSIVVKRRLITVPDAPHPICTLFSVKQMSLRQKADWLCCVESTLSVIAASATASPQWLHCFHIWSPCSHFQVPKQTQALIPDPTVSWLVAGEDENQRTCLFLFAWQQARVVEELGD